MTLPGYQVNITETPPNASAYTDIATLFAAGRALNPGFGLIYSVDQFQNVFGERQPQSSLYDAVQVFFREGGYRAYVSAVEMPVSDGNGNGNGETLNDNSDVIGSLDAFTPDLGPGTVTAPGITDSDMHLALAGTTQYDRIALLDAPDTNDIQALTTASAAITGQTITGHGDRFSAMFAPWDVAPGLIPGTTRLVPPSARIAGNLARNDASGYSSGDPAAGVLGIANYIQGLSQPAWTDQDRTVLNESSVNISRVIQSGIRTYGWRSLADQTLDSNWTMFNSSRTVMAVKAQLSIVAENFVFSKLDSMTRVTTKFSGAISAALLDFYNNGDLYGDTSQEAFVVDVGPAVNTPSSFAQGILAANVGLKTASMAEQVIINIAKVPITEALPTASTFTTTSS